MLFAKGAPEMLVRRDGSLAPKGQRGRVGLQCKCILPKFDWIFSLPELMNFELLGKTSVVVNIKFELFAGHPLSK